MAENNAAGWEPQGDLDYGQRLVTFLLRRYSLLLIAGALLVGILFGFVSLFLRSSYSTYASLEVNKGASSGLQLSGISLLTGGGNPAVKDEILIISSREIGLQVIKDLGLSVDVYDPHNPDSAYAKLGGLVGAYSSAGSFIDRYTPLRVTDVQISKDLLKPFKVWISADAQGNWRAAGKSGRSGQPLELAGCRLTPVFGPAHKAGARYLLKVYPDWMAWREYRGSVSASPADKDTSVVTVSARNHNPVLAKEIVAKIVELYLARNNQTTYGDYDTLLQFITAQSSDAERRVKDLANELKTYQETNKLYVPDKQGEAAVKTIADMSAERAGNMIEINRIDHILGSMSKRTPQEIYQYLQAPATALPIEQSLLANLSSALARLEDARLTKTEAHPEVVGYKKAVDVALDQIKTSLQAERKNTLIANTEIDRDIADARGELAKLPAGASKIGLLTAEMEANQNVLSLLKQKEAETLLRKAGTSSEVRMLDEPYVPTKRDSPTPGRNAALGVLVGLILGILCALMLEGGRLSFRSLKEVRLGAGLNLLAVLPGPPARRRWKPRQVHPKTGAQLWSVLSEDNGPLALVHLGGDKASYDLCWELTAPDGQGGKSRALILDLFKLGGGIAEALGVELREGLAEAAADPARLESLTHALDDSRALLGPGQGTAIAESVEALLPKLLESFTKTVVCLPRPSQWINPAMLKPLTARVVLVIPQGACSKAEVLQAASRLRGGGVTVAGAVVTNFAAKRDALGREELAFVSYVPALD